MNNIKNEILFVECFFFELLLYISLDLLTKLRNRKLFHLLKERQQCLLYTMFYFFFQVILHNVYQSHWTPNFFTIWIQRTFTRVHFFELRYYGTPPCCDVLFIEINHKIKGTFIVSFLKFSSNIVAQWVGWFPTNLKVMSLNPPGVLNFLPV